MKSLFAAPEREPSHFVGFAGNILDRDAENRSEETLPAALAEPQTRILVSRGGRLALRMGLEAMSAYFRIDEAEALGVRLADAVLLGRKPGGSIVMAPGTFDAEALPEGIKAIDHRSIYSQGLLAEETLGELAQGAALLTWHATHKFCGRCGQPTEPRIGGYKRVCTGCAAELFPRSDPVAIMLTVTRTHCLLGRSPHFQPGMYSALAGFIEPGETIEAAVRRETFEEAGIRLGRVTYHASQPWPFPYSLMIGCFGEALNEDIVFDGKELEDCRWFSRAEVRQMIAGTHPEGIKAPHGGAIAAHLVGAWAAEDD